MLLLALGDEVFDLAYRYLTLPLIVGLAMTFAGTLLWSFAPGMNGFLLILFGFINSISSRRELINRNWRQPNPTYWPGYAAFLAVTAFALFLVVYLYDGRIERVAMFWLLVLLSSGALLLLRLILGRTDRPKKREPSSHG